MLQVIGTLPVDSTTLKVDEYIPFIFRCQEYASSVPFYWRTGDFDAQLLEVGINEQLGVVCAVTLNGVGSIIEEDKEDPHVSVDGLPIIEMSAWSGGRLDQGSDYDRRFRDEKRTYKVWVGKNHIRLQLHPQLTVRHWLAAGRLEFGTDDSNHIVALYFSSLSDEEMKILNFHLLRSAQ